MSRLCYCSNIPQVESVQLERAESYTLSEKAVTVLSLLLYISIIFRKTCMQTLVNAAILLLEFS